MKVGSFVFATEQGLGYLAKSFYDAGVVTHPLIVHHGGRTTHTDWYPPDTPVVTNLRQPRQISQMLSHCEGMDAMLFFETPFVWEAIAHCRSRGIKTALMVMYECTRTVLPETPDVILCPSLLDLDYYPHGLYIPVPVEPQVAAGWRRRGKVETFVHNAGHGGLKGRNGTAELIQALKFIKSPAEIIIRHQTEGYPFRVSGAEAFNCRLHVECGTIWRDRLYSEGAAFVFPEKFNGLSLPLQEAHASGMLVMATRRHPTTAWLPNEPLILSDERRTGSIGVGFNTYNEAVVRPENIAAAIDSWYGRDAGEYSDAGKKWAEANSWDVLKSEYLAALGG